MSAGIHDFDNFEQGTTFSYTFDWTEDFQTVTSMTLASSTVTVSLANHCYSTGDYVKFVGADQCAYNDTFEITVVDNDSFTFSLGSTPNSPATGTITCAKAKDLTGYTAAMQFKSKKGGTALLSASTSTGEITITPLKGKIAVVLDDDTTAALDFSKAYYDLEITSSGGTVTRLLEGLVILNKEVTTI